MVTTKREPTKHYGTGDMLFSTSTREDGTARRYVFRCIQAGTDETALWAPLGRAMTRSEINTELGVPAGPARRTHD